MEKSFSNGQGRPFFLRSLDYYFRGFLTPPEKHENPAPLHPPEIQEPWDHAQMIERKILCRIALTRALYDQIRPYYFQKYDSDFHPEV